MMDVDCKNSRYGLEIIFDLLVMKYEQPNKRSPVFVTRRCQWVKLCTTAVDDGEGCAK